MLDKRSKNIVIVFGVFIAILMITEISRPTPINWRPSYTANDKIPFGSYVLYNQLPSFFPTAEIETITEDPYEFLRDSTDYGTNKAYIFIDRDISFDGNQERKLRNFVAEGNTVFVSSNFFFFQSNDSISTGAAPEYAPIDESIKTNLFTTSYQPDSLPSFKKGMANAAFYELDTLNTKALGYYKYSEEKELEEDETPRDSLNFVEMKHGKGTFYFHTVPETFSNYYMLRGNQDYAAAVLSYIDAETIYLDAYKKSGKKVVSSPMRFVFNQIPLKWAYYLLLGGLLLFVIFRGKREQRIIEVVKPLENTSIEFTKTIGDLYFQHKDYGNIIAKKITYFLETIRTRYYLRTNELNSDFTKKLALKSGNSKQETEALITKINQLRSRTMHTEADLIELNKLIEGFRL